VPSLVRYTHKVDSRLPPLNALRAFEAAARLGSFTAAADALHVTHGAISRQVRMLEDWLGLPLFERQGRRVLLTGQGRDYLHAVQAGFDTITAATRRLTESRSKRQITINALPTFTMHWLLPRLTRFQMRFPGVEMRLVTSDRPLAVAAGEFDVAIRRGPGDWTGYLAGEFLVEHEIPVCSPALLARLPLAEPKDLARHTLLSSVNRSFAWERWLALAGMTELHVAGRQQFDHFYLALQAAVDGLGVVLGPRPVIDDELASGRLVAPLPGPSVRSRAYCWVMPKSRAADPVLRAFCDWITEEACIVAGKGTAGNGTAPPGLTVQQK
jgi:LysR family transcriptional regulator, glycine cleavage system transcriptional activator